MTIKISEDNTNRKIRYYERSGKDMDLYIRRRFSSIKTGAKKRKIKLDISLDDIFRIYKLQKGSCKLTGIKLKCDYANKKIRPFNLSIDRINSKKHYSKDNIRLALSIINRMLWSFDDKDVFYFIKKTLIKNKKIKISS